MTTVVAERRPVAAAERSAPAAPRERAWLTLFDPLRILASVSVVWVHARGEMAFGVGFGLFLFLMMMFGLATGGTLGEPLLTYARRRARMLLGPWLRWSAFYVLLYLALDGLVAGRDPSERWRWQMVVYGGSRHLWFLPYAMGAVLVLHVAMRMLRRVPPEAAVLALALLGALGTSLAELAVVELPLPLMGRHWVSAAPALAFGLAFGCALRLPEPRRRRAALAVIVGLGWLAWLVSPLANRGLDILLRYAVALTLAAAGFAWRPRVPTWITRLSTVTFGVYLAHPLWIELAALVPALATAPAAVHVGLVWSGAALTVWLLRFLPVWWPELRKPPKPRTEQGPRGAREPERAAAA